MAIKAYKGTIYVKDQVTKQYEEAHPSMLTTNIYVDDIKTIQDKIDELRAKKAIFITKAMETIEYTDIKTLF